MATGPSGFVQTGIIYINADRGDSVVFAFSKIMPQRLWKVVIFFTQFR